MVVRSRCQPNPTCEPALTGMVAAVSGTSLHKPSCSCAHIRERYEPCNFEASSIGPVKM